MSLLLVALVVAVALALAFGAGRVTASRISGREIAGMGLLAVAALLALARQFALALPAGAAGLAMLRGGRAARRAQPTPGQTSEARTDALAMTLDHDTGAIDGEVTAGRFSGRVLSGMDAAELQALAGELEDDPDSLGLLLAYLERRGGGGDGGAGRGGAGGGAMTEAEALRILGLAAGASPEEVRAAHRRLIRRVHPDLGGSDALAAMINAAKARLDP